MLDSFYVKQPLNLAHRGARCVAPPNTLAAFVRALELGADGVELDVHLSADGVPVVIHDFSLEATTNGHGSVSSKTLAELKELDAGSTFDLTFAGERIPSLDQVFEAIGKLALINIELKALGPLGRGLEPAVAALVQKHGLENRVLFSSFNPFALRRIKRLLPHVPGGLLYAPDMPFYLRRAWLAPLCPHEARHPHHSMLTPSSLQTLRQRGYRINVWTVNDPADMRRMIELGVDAIITDHPDVLHQILRDANN
jgi:glycerophosphoryl diester phosphodiesterase